MKTDLIHGKAEDVMRTFPDGHFDMILTSPPYDNLRTYNQPLMRWDSDVWERVLREAYRVLKNGGVAVWIVADSTVNGSETGTSFRQALYAMECGFRLNDTMIWEKPAFTATGALVARYAQVFEYMFVFTKGKAKTFNPIKDRPNKHAGAIIGGTIRNRNGTTRAVTGSGVKRVAEYGQRFNVWKHAPQSVGWHPAPFPVGLASDIIRSWTNEGDIVLDPFSGSGSTGVACARTGRGFVGIECNNEYVYNSRKRISDAHEEAVEDLGLEEE